MIAASFIFFSERFGSGDGEHKTLLTRQIAFEPLPASVLLNKAAPRQDRSGARGVDGCASIFGGLDRLGLSRFRVYVQLSFFPSPVACSRTFNVHACAFGR
jgi:hypothetical protein